MTAERGARTVLTLPAEMCRDLGIVRGDDLEIERVEGGLWIKPAMAAAAPDWRDDPIWKLCGAFASKEQPPEWAMSAADAGGRMLV